MKPLSHLDEAGRARMVDVAGKQVTDRRAVARALVRMSPQTYATDIHTPLLILHSESDLRCPVVQAEQLFTTLRLLQRDVEFVRFPAEGHELSRSGNPWHRVMRFEVILDWLKRHLSS